MRLIDADVLWQAMMSNRVFHANTSREESLLRRCEQLVDDAPTVEAIPKEKLEEICKRLEEKKQEYLEGFRTHQEDELYGVACGFGDSIKICKEVGGMVGGMNE